MNSYRVTVVASFTPGVDLFGIFAALPQRTPGIPDIDTSAVDMSINEDVRISPKRQTLTAIYDVEGRGVDEARTFALAVYKLDADKLGLPGAETVLANPED
jgi:hypothetical protein